jgi:hypothetical protein
MILFQKLEYCSNCAKIIKTIADADEKEKIEVKPIFMCPFKKCDTKLSFKVLKKYSFITKTLSAVLDKLLLLSRDSQALHG